MWMWRWRRGGKMKAGGETDVCLWEVYTLCISEPSLLLKLSPPCRPSKAGTVTAAPSLRLTSKYPTSQHRVTMAKPNNPRFVNRTMCVCFRLTTAFPPLLSPSPHPTQDREIACNWLWMDCGWQEGRAVCLR